jgi:hypothetical protein
MSPGKEAAPTAAALRRAGRLSRTLLLARLLPAAALLVTGRLVGFVDCVDRTGRKYVRPYY